MAANIPEELSNLDEPMSTYLSTATKIAEEAGKMLYEAYHKSKNVRGKEDINDLVTDTDKIIETFIFSSLKSQFSNHCFIGEETTSETKSICLTNEPTWIVDPIDGTCNFIHRFPYVAVCIGLVIEKKVVLGVIVNPVMKETYMAVRGHGSYLNKTKLQITDPPQSLSDSLMACEWGASRDPNLLEKKGRNFIDSISKTKVHGMRSTGSAALNMCLVACGALDLYYEWGPHCWDVAAAAIIVEEAGGVNNTTLGKPFDLMCRTIICAKTQNLINELLPTIQEIPTSRDDE